MSVTAQAATPNVPLYYDIAIGTAAPSGVINVGDWLLYSGQKVFAGSGFTPANKVSGAGVALQCNPYYDSYGNIITATQIEFVRQGVVRVSAYSGAWSLGTPVYASATGSGVAAPTGLTGVGAIWAEGNRQLASGATAAGLSTGNGIVVGCYRQSNGSAQIDVLITPQFNLVY